MVLRSLATLFGLLACLSMASVAEGHKRGHHHHGKKDARHSLRAPVTGENFYFVMADRFENGSIANDDGGLPRGKGEGESGYDPTGTGWYHGGDLEGMLEQIDYIQDLGTTAIWLTPSFKNKAVQVQDSSAGYHGYWITDFTQIDPHLGSNEDLRALVDAAHERGMKVYFDIITNHTADVIGYTDSQRKGYTSKDRRPYTDAAGTPFDDRDYAGTDTFPPLNRTTSFPYVPQNAPGPLNVKVPGWLNDERLYHNRGDTTFVGEDSYYGDFFGLDDLFTEHPDVVDGMIDIYKGWITDFRIDGFRIDTMKHVNDEFWETFAPEILSHARRLGLRQFYAFGEVFDTTKAFTSHFTTQAKVQGVLDFPFQKAAENFAAWGRPTNELRDFFVGDDWYTDADSNVYQLPTFLGNHDMGRIGRFVLVANPGLDPDDPEALRRDVLAHELMYLSRGNPVIYYGDEQGFVGDGGDQGARQDMFPSQVGSYNDDDLIATDATTAVSNFDDDHPLFRAISSLADLTERYPALRDGAHQHRYSTGSAGVYAYSRLARREQREFVVAVNNSESPQTAAVPTYSSRTWFKKVYGSGTGSLRTSSDSRLLVTVPPLSAIVYRAQDKLDRSRHAPSVSVTTAPEGRDRLEVGANVSGSSFYEVTFKAKVGRHRWKAIGTDDTAPYRVFHDVADLRPGKTVRYKAVVLDNAGHTRTSRERSARVAEPAIVLEAPNDNGRVRGEVEVRAVATPEHAHYTVQIQRSVNDGAWTNVGSPDTSSPVYTAFDSTAGLADRAVIRYRAVLTYAPGRTVTSATRSVTHILAPVETAIIHYNRSPVGDWGLHLFDGDPGALEPGEATADWNAPTPFEGTDSFGVFHTIDIANDTKRVGFIVHRPSGDTVPDSREPPAGANRYFVPLESPEIWLRVGDPTVYTTRPAP